MSLLRWLVFSSPVLLILLVLLWDWLRWLRFERDHASRIGANWGVTRLPREGMSHFKQRILDAMTGRSREAGRG